MPHSEKDSTTAALPSLTTLVHELRTGKLPLAEYITRSCARIQEWEPFIQALNNVCLMMISGRVFLGLLDFIVLEVIGEVGGGFLPKGPSNIF